MMLPWPAGFFTGNTTLLMLFLITHVLGMFREMSPHDRKGNETVNKNEVLCCKGVIRLGLINLHEKAFSQVLSSAVVSLAQLPEK